MSPRWYIRCVTYGINIFHDINIFHFNSRINIGRHNEMILRDGIVFASLMTILIWRCMHRASSYNVYMNQQDAQNSCD